MIDALTAAIASPDLVYVMMMVGMVGILVEVSHPGSIWPGVAGGASLVPALLAFRVLPVRYVAVWGIVVGLGFLVAQVFVKPRRLLAALGCAVLFASSFLFTESPQEVSFLSVCPTVAAVVTFFVLGGGVVRRAAQRGDATGETMVGLEGMWIADGAVKIGDEVWGARATGSVVAGAPVRVVAIEGLMLVVDAGTGDIGTGVA